MATPSVAGVDEMISESTTAAAGRFLAAYPLLTNEERTKLLVSLLEVAFAEGAQYLALTAASRIAADGIIQKAKA